MPSKEQIRELFDEQYTTTTWTNKEGFYGRLITSKLNGKSIFLPAAGQNNSYSWNSNFITDNSEAGIHGYYWSRSLDESYSDQARDTWIESSEELNPSHLDLRFYGQSVRPVRKQ